MDKKYINPMISSMAGRLGIYNGSPKIDDPTLNIQDSVNTAIDGVHQQSSLLNLYGGHAQQERMIQDKKRSLDRALRYSYQGATVQDIEKEESYRALINPNKVKLDYDEKIISINWESQFQPGTIFEWQETNTHWLVMYQDLTELAYFKGDCRKCHYIINWANTETAEVYNTYASIVGPKEAVQSSVKSGISLDERNYTISLLIPHTELTNKYFSRYTKFYLQPIGEEKPYPVCWQVTSVDNVSNPGIIQLTAKEILGNKDTDDMNIPDYKLIVDKIIQQEGTQTMDLRTPQIIGENLIIPKSEYTYTCESTGDWKVTGISCPITIVRKDAKTLVLRWEKMFSGQFSISKGNVVKNITVQTLY